MGDWPCPSSSDSYRLLSSQKQECCVSVTRHRYHFRLRNSQIARITSLELDVINIGFPFSSSHAHCLNLFLRTHSSSLIHLIKKKKKKHHTSSAVHICRRSASCHTMNSSTARKPQVHCGKVANRPASSSPNVTIRRTTTRELVKSSHSFLDHLFKYKWFFVTWHTACGFYKKIFQVAKGNFVGLDLKKPQLQTTTNEIKPKQDTNPPENTVLPTSRYILYIWTAKSLN